MSKQSDLVSVSQGASGDPLYIDTTNDRVGIGTTSPVEALTVSSGNSNSCFVQVTNTDAGEGDNQGLYVGLTTADEGYLGTRHNADLIFAANNAEALRIDSSGDLDLLAGQLLMAGNTTYQILNIYSGADNTTYSTSSQDSTLGGVMSTSVGVSPTTSTSKLIVLWRARSNIRRTAASGNDARGDLFLRWYDGTTYSGNNAANFSTQIGMVNTTGTNSDPMLLHYTVPVITTFLDQTYTRSDTGNWTLRLYGSCDYTSNEITTENISYLLIEVDNGT